MTRRFLNEPVRKKRDYRKPKNFAVVLISETQKDHWISHFFEHEEEARMHIAKSMAPSRGFQLDLYKRMESE